MFFVYGIGGRVFRGSVEQLRQIGGVGAVARSRAIRPSGQDGRDPVDAFPNALLAADAAAEVPLDASHRSALAAYAGVQNVVHEPKPLHLVADLMTRDALTIEVSATIAQAWQQLAQRDVEQAPVVDDAGVLVGLLVRADLMRPHPLVTPDGPPVSDASRLTQTVAQLMRTPIPSVVPEADIRWVAGVLLDESLPGLPVIHEDGTVCGFIARSDLVRAVATHPPLDLWG